MSETLGAYISNSHLDHELVLTFWPERFALQWVQCGKIPDFVANYLASIAERRSPSIGAYVHATVSYLLNELVENSVKFHLSGTIRLRVGIDGDDLILIVTNQILKTRKPELIAQFSELLQRDPEELFLSRVEENAAFDERSVSKLGFLSMIVDYQARLGWQFTPVTNNDDKVWMHTMVRVPYFIDEDDAQANALSHSALSI